MTLNRGIAAADTHRVRTRPLPLLVALLAVLAAATAYAVVSFEHSSLSTSKAPAVEAPLGGVPAHHPRVGPGAFTSSSPLLDRIWTASVNTANDMLVKGGLTKDAYDRPCRIDAPVVIVDGYVRDRCPYIGDESVADLALDAADPHFAAQRSMLAWFAAAQHPNGAIPASPVLGGKLVLFDYNAYWLQTLYEYVLYSGDVAFARSVWPNVERLLGWYGRQTIEDGPDRGLLVNRLGASDYAFVHRRGDVVAYYNAQYALALHETARLARWLGKPADARRIDARAHAVARAFDAAFWDAQAGAFQDTTVDPSTHPEDGNAFAILAGLASPSQARSALAYLTEHDAGPRGNTFVDSSTWDHRSWGFDANERIYPFITYDEVLARFQSGENASALDLIDREWGYMVTHGPKTTVWETINAVSGGPEGSRPSWDHGWSAGAAPALTTYVLGVEPTSPGFATFTVAPHAAGLTEAAGVVPTPHGTIRVSWVRHGGELSLRVRAPRGTRWTNPPA